MEETKSTEVFSEIERRIHQKKEGDYCCPLAKIERCGMSDFTSRCASCLSAINFIEKCPAGELLIEQKVEAAKDEENEQIALDISSNLSRILLKSLSSAMEKVLMKPESENVFQELTELSLEELLYYHALSNLYDNLENNNAQDLLNKISEHICEDLNLNKND